MSIEQLELSDASLALELALSSALLLRHVRRSSP
jgi:hypothetical protein